MKTELSDSMAVGLALAKGNLRPVVNRLAAEVRKASIPEVTDELINEAAEASVGELLSDLRVRHRVMVKRLTAQAWKDGWSDEELAERISHVVGLDAGRADAVERHRRALIGQEVPKGIARERAREYAARLRAERAMLIARTEMARMVADAKRRSWALARERGLIDQYAVRVYHTSTYEVECPICRPLNGQRASITGTYKGGVVGPPMHPNCQCHETLERGPVVLAKLDDSFKYRHLVR